jgi:hypothetical protein
VKPCPFKARGRGRPRHTMVGFARVLRCGRVTGWTMRTFLGAQRESFAGVFFRWLLRRGPPGPSFTLFPSSSRPWLKNNLLRHQRQQLVQRSFVGSPRLRLRTPLPQDDRWCIRRFVVLEFSGIPFCVILIRRRVGILRLRSSFASRRSYCAQDDSVWEK